MKLRSLTLIIILLTIATTAFTAVLDDYRTNGSNTWATLSIWQRYNGTAWVAATVTPTSANANVITIRNGHTVTVAADVAVDQLTVDATGNITINTGITLTIANGTGTDMAVNGTVDNKNVMTTTGTLVFKTGSTYIHNQNGGTVPNATWQTGSTLKITGLTTTKPSLQSVHFYNVIWDCAGQTANLNTTNADLQNIDGDLTVINTGTGTWRLASTATGSKNVLGNFTIQGGTVNMAFNSGWQNINLSGNFIMSGGVLTETGTGTGNGITFVKAGTQLFNKTGGTISNSIHFVVNSGSTLDIVNQPISGGGDFTLNNGAGLVVRDNNGISTSGLTGAIQVTGTRTYNSGANYIYQGTAIQSTGNGLPASVNNLTINNSFGVNLTNPVAVDGVLTQTSGTIAGSTAVDGYSSQALEYLNIGETNNNITGFSVAMTTPVLMPTRPNRSWNITGTYAGSKTITFYWNNTDDIGLDWTGKIPAIWKGYVKYPATAYDVVSAQRFVTVSVTASLTKGIYVVGLETGDELPVELSSFTATQTGETLVKMTWVTQSETNVLGYYVYRNSNSGLDDAIMISPMIHATNTTEEATYSFTDHEATSGVWYYWLQNQDMNGDNAFHGPVSIDMSGNHNPNTVVPAQTNLGKVYPNPFHSAATITYGLSKSEHVSINIYNMKGQLVKTLVSETKEAGSFQPTWNGTDNQGKALPSGLYLIKMITDDSTSTSKVLFVK